MNGIIFVAFCAAVAASAALASPISLQEDLKDHQSRIIGGQTAALGQFPNQALSLINLGTVISFCGGSLIRDSWVLTSASCVTGVFQFNVTLGSVNRSEDSRVEVVTSLAILHEDYNPRNLNNNIALIFLDQKVTFTDNIQPIRLARDHTDNGERLTVSGWGTTEQGEVISPVLKYVDVTTISNAKCEEVYGDDIVVDTVLCTVGNPNQGPCNGDSGGPLVRRASDGVLEQVGVVSFVHGSGCGSGNPSGYVRVADYVDWIDNAISEWEVEFPSN